ncbi:MAG: c-type cytochrome domain-containing protein, partial [Bacteroidota bacterium]
TLTYQDIDSKVIPSSNVSFGEYIQPVFRLKCNNANCHNSQDRAGKLSLDNHAEATSNFLVVFPGMPDNSKLVWAIEGRTTSPMPPIGLPPLTKNQINGIRTWIKEGAKNN